MKRLLRLVRHGRTADNASGVFQGQSGRGLDDVGRSQAERLAERLRGLTIGALVSSDLDRARETSEIVAKALGIPVVFDLRLREIDVGVWSGLTAEQVRSSRPEEHASWARGEDVRRGGGETYAEAASRVMDAVKEWAQRTSEGDLVVVSHGTVIRGFTALVIGAPVQGSWGWPVMENTGISSFSLDGSTFRFVGWNDTGHLVS